MTPRERTGKKRFRAVIDDGGFIPHWEVWTIIKKNLIGYRCAEFYGENCMRYARRHAKMLNGLKREEQP